MLITEAVTNVDELVKKYGTKGISLLVSKFVELSPEFKGDIELARELGRAMADLEFALNDAINRSPTQ